MRSKNWGAAGSKAPVRSAGFILRAVHQFQGSLQAGKAGASRMTLAENGQEEVHAGRLGHQSYCMCWQQGGVASSTVTLSVVAAGGSGPKKKHINQWAASCDK